MTARAEDHSLVKKVREVGARLREHAAGVSRVAEAALQRETLARLELNAARSELAGAMKATLAVRDEAMAQARWRVVCEFILRQQGRPPRRRTSLTVRIEAYAARTGRLGREWVIARARIGSSPSLFDAAWYLAQNPDVAASGVSPLFHYLVIGSWEGRSPHPLFDEAHYRRQHSAVLAVTNVSSLEHYLSVSAWEAASPHPLFDVAHYLSQVETPPGEDPLSHYLRQGWREGRSPHPLFDPVWYAAQAGDLGADEAPLLHYVQGGWRQGLSPHPLFDPDWYRATYPDVGTAGVEPLSDFLTWGASMGRSPSPRFDAPAYALARGAAIPRDTNVLIDYLQGGAWRISDLEDSTELATMLAAAPLGLTPLEYLARRDKEQGDQPD